MGAKAVLSTIQANYSVAERGDDLALAVCRSQLRKDHRSRVSRTTGKPVQSSFFSRNMDHHRFGCWVLECDEDQEQEIERSIIDTVYDLLSHRR